MEPSNQKISLLPKSIAKLVIFGVGTVSIGQNGHIKGNVVNVEVVGDTLSIKCGYFPENKNGAPFVGSFYSEKNLDEPFQECNFSSSSSFFSQMGENDWSPSFASESGAGGESWYSSPFSSSSYNTGGGFTFEGYPDDKRKSEFESTKLRFHQKNSIWTVTNKKGTARLIFDEDFTNVKIESETETQTLLHTYVLTNAFISEIVLMGDVNVEEIASIYLNKDSLSLIISGTQLRHFQCYKLTL